MNRNGRFWAVVAGLVLTACARTPTATFVAPTAAATFSPPTAAAAATLAPSAALTAQSVPVHLWISNQSVGPGTSDVPMTVSIDGAPLFNKVMPLGMGHNVAMVDQNLAAGTHTLTINVGKPYGLSSDKVIDLTGELWVSVEFWFNPGSTDATQRAPSISIELTDTSPVIF